MSFRYAACVGLALWLLPSVLPAQTPVGAIVGTVRDTSGAVVPGARVIIRNVQTGVQNTVETDELGNYMIAYLTPGEYQVRCERGGFESFQRTGILLQMDHKLRVDIDLQVGEATETVTVNAGTPLLETETSTLGQVIDTRKVLDLPQVDSNVFSLVALAPGVQTQPGAAFPSIGGGRATASSILLDGVENHRGIPIYVPSGDAIQEFKVLTHAFSAEYGRTGGGIVSLAIKSGTNQFHGSAFEFFRNDVLNARNFFALPGSKKPVVRYNRFGGTVGGPIRRDRLFFFVSYGGQRNHSVGTFVNTVPTLPQRGGDFSEGTQAPIFDPATTRPDPVRPGSFLRDPFAGNQVPSSRTDPAAARLIQLFPVPNAPGLVSNYVSSSVGRTTDNNVDVRVDHRLSNSDSFFVRYSHGSNIRIPSKVLPGLADRTGGNLNIQTRNVALQEVHTFNPRLINEFRLGYTRIYTLQETAGYPENQAAVFGIPNFPALGMPTVNISGTAGLGPNPRSLINEPWQYFYLLDSLTVVQGRHTIKTGADIQVSRIRRFQPDVGTLSFDSTFSSQPGVPNTGIGLASFLLGLPTSGSVGLSQIGLNFRTSTPSFFVQDDWKASSGLTLNLGLRFDGSTPITELNDQISNFNLQTGKLERVGREGRPRSPFDFESKFGPRFGFAWQPRGLRRAVVRGGYGIFYSSVKDSNAPISFPWGSGASVSVSTVDNINPPFVLSQGPPPAILKVPEGFIGPGFGANVITFERLPAFDYVQNWQLSWQYELFSKQLLLDAAYAGSKGTHLLANVPINQVPPDQMGPGNFQTRLPFPQFGQVNSWANRGSSIYHSLQVKAEGRFREGLTFLASYTFARDINDFSGPNGGAFNAGINQSVQNVYNLRAERSIGGFNIPHRFVFSYNYELPFGQGQRFLDSAKWWNLLLGGWQINGITTLQSGGPVAMGAVPNTCNCINPGGLDSGLRPNRLKDGRLPASERSLQRYFDTSAFSAPAPYTFGNSEKNLLLGPGLVNFDFSALKRFRLGGDRRNLEFRSELFDLFNTPQFASPSAILGTPQFGRITAARSARVIQMALKLYF
ncbi:MAG: TonB-dependent receptor [Acidobacteria bacterium]|nr:TonB-dependent receptor [Acidobacteriota bacterium]